MDTTESADDGGESVKKFTVEAIDGIAHECKKWDQADEHLYRLSGDSYDPFTMPDLLQSLLRVDHATVDVELAEAVRTALIKCLTRRRDKSAARLRSVGIEVTR